MTGNDKYNGTVGHAGDGNDDASDGPTQNSPPVAADYWVTLSYELFDSLGQPLEQVRRKMTYLHGGYGEVLPKIEAAMDGKSVGDECSLYLEPDDAFGDYDADLVTLLPAERLPDAVEIGMTFDGIPGEAADGHVYSVTDIAQGHVVLDGNHPLAGIAVRYEIRIDAVREASDEEIEREALAVQKEQS